MPEQNAHLKYDCSQQKKEVMYIKYTSDQISPNKNIWIQNIFKP
jgi:hypothetical protein